MIRRRSVMVMSQQTNIVHPSLISGLVPRTSRVRVPVPNDPPPNQSQIQSTGDLLPAPLVNVVYLSRF